MPMSQPDKIEDVFSGVCRQSTRHVPKYEETKELKYQVGDRLLIFEWLGKPYFSKWGRRIKETVSFVGTMLVCEDGVTIHDGYKPLPWDDGYLDGLAEKDGLKPPTGVRLKEVLFALHPECDFERGEVFQVVRW